MLETKAQDMFRYKGLLAVKGKETKFIFQGRLGMWSRSLGTERFSMT